MRAKLGSWWQMTRKLLVIAVPIALVILVVLFMYAAYQFNWKWTGLTGGYTSVTTTKTVHGITTLTLQPPVKTLWDWLSLLSLLAVPVVVALATLWFSMQQGKASGSENKDNQREVALQAYIDKISELLLHENLRESAKEDEVRKIARVRTLTILGGLDATRKATVLQFLQETGLIDKNKHVIDLSEARLDGAELFGANLSAANLSAANLSSADLSEAHLFETDLSRANLSVAQLFGANLFGANLSKANLSKANLSKADLGTADLSEANLHGADLSGADLRGANLSEADLGGAKLDGADLSEADLSEADLSGADLGGADLCRANLSAVNLNEADLDGANLTEATFTTEQLEKVKSLQGATMPNKSMDP